MPLNPDLCTPDAWAVVALVATFVGVFLALRSRS